MKQNDWALKEFSIDATKDIETFLKEVEANPYFQEFIEIMKKLQDQNFRSLLYGIVPAAELHATGLEFILSPEIGTIFDLKRAYEGFENLVYYLVDDECLTLAEIDYDYAFSLTPGTVEKPYTEKLHVLCTGLWNTSLSPYDFFCRYLDKEVKARKDIGIYDMLEISKVNKVRYHCFNTLDGVKDFTSFIAFLYDKHQKVFDEYNDERLGPFVGLSYFESCQNILSSYLDSTTTEEATKDENS